MSPGALLQAAIVDAIVDEPAFGGIRVFDAPPVRAGRPYVVVEDPLVSDWGTKDVPGREARIAVLSYDVGERPLNLRILSGAVETVIEDCPTELGDGWRLVSMRLIRSRMLNQGEGQWAAMAEFRALMLRTN